MLPKGDRIPNAFYSNLKTGAEYPSVLSHFTQKTLYFNTYYTEFCEINMTKNITVGIPDELSKRMDELTEVNWSAVTRDCIEQYIKQRTAENLEKIIAKVKQKRSNDFKKGYEFVIKNVDELELPELEEIAHLDANRAERLYYIVHSRPVPNEMLINNLFDITRDPVIGTIIEFIVSSEFLKGMQEAAKEIVEKSK